MRKQGVRAEAQHSRERLVDGRTVWERTWQNCVADKRVECRSDSFHGTEQIWEALFFIFQCKGCCAGVVIVEEDGDRKLEVCVALSEEEARGFA